MQLTASSTSTSAFLEAFLSPSLASDVVELSRDTASLLLDRTVVVSSVPVSACSTSTTSAPSLPSLSAVTISVHVSKTAAEVGQAPPATTALQWCALFRRAFHNRVVFTGMRATLRVMTCPVAVEVLHAQRRTAEGAQKAAAPVFGVLASGTSICVSDSNGDADAEALAGGSGSSNDTAAQPLMCEANTLFVGEAGTGKTHQLRLEAERVRSTQGHHVVELRVEALPQGEGSEVGTVTALRELLTQAKRSAPCTVLLDDLHLICSRSSSSSAGSQWAMSLIAHALCEELRTIREGGLPVRVLASAPAEDALDSALLTHERFGGHVVHLQPPSTAEERLTCLQACVAACGGSPGPAVAVEVLREVAGHTHGFTQRDLHRLVEAAQMESFKRQGSTAFAEEDVRAAAKLVHPSSLRQFEVSVPEVTWDDIGGSGEAKKTLQEVVAWCLGKQRWIFTEFQLTPPKGVLLYGPPGCSKTMLAKALANESHMNFISVKGPEVFSKWVGDSEKAVRDIFARARAAAPCVVFIDELDGMCGHRGRGGVSDRVISQFLTELDGLPSAFTGKSNALVFVAATNRPDSIDGAVLRPGRIDRRVHVGMPTLDEREAIAAIQFRRLPTSTDLTPRFVAERTAGYTGAEVVAVVKEAAFGAISADLHASCITTSDITAALKKVRPRMDPKDVEWYKNWPHDASKSAASTCV